MLDDLALFVAIAEAGGLSGAARRLGVPPATVTRRLQKLEERLGCQLVHRSARRFSLTGEGAAYLAQLGPLMAQIEHALRGLSADITELAGPVTVAAPTNLSIRILRPMWSGFVARHPEVELDLRLSNAREDLLEMGADLAIRVGPQPDSRMTQKRLGHAATVIVGAPGYLSARGRPAQPADLAAHRIIATSLMPLWKLAGADSSARAEPPLRAATMVDDIGLAAMLAADGQGLALLPVSEVAEEIRAGRLEQVLPGWRGPERGIYAIWPTGRLLSARARVLRDYMAGFIAAEPALQGEVPCAAAP
ncbi:LysR family transcriptional regulator [Poseidonocella sp. HB161398]|uniref:LysR family transcriptional regulator n=1 Tax=Poseidonocella sp. HB161398 TaxID=2320855 RepID=UPI001109555B|nr:LysR family transcriptional regulator [Poseidonocella sp. HB161398]